jgi:type I restriction system adenine methylase HsdM
LWAGCDELRGGMDASQYKGYVLIFLFMKYVSDKYAGDKCGMITIPEGCSFAEIATLKGDKEIGDKINKVIIRLTEANDLQGVIDVVDFNDSSKFGEGGIMVELLSNLIDTFQNPELDFSTDSASAGEVYEDLIRIFSNESGKGMAISSIPMAVNRLMAKSLGIPESHPGGDVSVYDPTCGPGSLLLQVAEEAGLNTALYGQELNSIAYAYARMNMILHGALEVELAKGNCLSEPQFLDGDVLKQFDYVVGCPPFSLGYWDYGLEPEHDRFSRFTYGIPPKNQGDFAFIQHMLASLKPEGRMAVLVPHGVLFRGGAEASIRQSMLESDLVEAVVGLPANLLSYTGIPTCLLICSKRKPEERIQKILFINADRQFSKERTKNVLLPEHVEKIVQALETYSDIEQFSRAVSLDEIRSNEFNLNIPRYVDTSELAVLLKQHCSQFKKYQIKDLAAEISATSVGKTFADKPNAVYIPRHVGHMRPPTAELSALPPGKHQHYFQVVLNDKAINHYVAQFLSSTIGRHALSALAQGSATPLINRASLAEVLVVLPSLNDQAANIQTHQRLIVLKDTIEKISQDLSLRPTASREFDDQLDSMLSVVGKLSIADQIRGVIRQGESKTVEFKETYSLCLRKKTKETYMETAVLKTIVAFLNSDGGTLLIGVNDGSEIIGIGREMDAFHNNDNDHFLKHLKNNLKARVGEQFYPFIDHELIEVDGLQLVRFQCIPSDHPCYLDGKDFYVRTNPASDKIEGPTLVEYVNSHFGK